jgi:two-component system LytT family response regulator
MKIIIVDDEQACATEVQKMVVKYFPQFEICGVYNKIKEATEGIINHQPDLVFLDVELNQGKTGFDLLERITPRLFEVIFITAYDKFAARAFQYSALHYIQKPIDELLFSQAVNKAIETKNMKDFAKRFDVLLNSVRSGHLMPQKIMIPNIKSDGWLYLDVNQIVRIDSDGRQIVKVTYMEKDKYLYTGIGKYIGEVERMFEGHDFIRVHESHLVNINHIKSYKRDQRILVMSDEKEIEVSRRNVNLLMDKLKKR